ncbi:MarR family transcriptional regulator [Pokkaliibacter sp. CJK22405]|uniref:MarR family transcriptional regulator n=1 Tax=Pokkaliibacter sp. CJK22405 TaxID=3384615 RepID=UPI0039850B83
MANYDGEAMASVTYTLGHLVHLLNVYKDRQLDKYLAPYDVTAAQFKVLLTLARQGDCSVACLSKALPMDSGAATRMVDRLVQKELVERARNEEDRRQIQVRLTPQGEAFRLEIHKVAADFLNEFTEPLSRDELTELERLMKKLLAPSGMLKEQAQED